jgi:hypothetical protein
MDSQIQGVFSTGAESDRKTRKKVKRKKSSKSREKRASRASPHIPFDEPPYRLDDAEDKDHDSDDFGLGFGSSRSGSFADSNRLSATGRAEAPSPKLGGWGDSDSQDDFMMGGRSRQSSRPKQSSGQLARSQQQGCEGISTDEEGPAAGWRASDSESDGAAMFARALAGTGGEPPDVEDRPARTFPRTFQPLRPVPWRGGFSYGGGESSEDQHEDDYEDEGGAGTVGPMAMRDSHRAHEAGGGAGRSWGWGAEAARGAPAAHSRAHASAATATRLHRGPDDSDGPEDAFSALDDDKQARATIRVFEREKRRGRRKRSKKRIIECEGKRGGTREGEEKRPMRVPR